MFLKNFKSTISLALALIFVLTLMPSVGMAEIVVTEPAISMINVINTRGSVATGGHQIAFSSYKNTIKLQSGTNTSDWRAYGQFDLAEYQEILANPSTKVTFGLTVGGEFRTHLPSDFKVYVMNDNCDYFEEDITYNSAAELGLHEPVQNGQIISDVAAETYTALGDKHKTGDIKDKILQVLKQGENNSLITLVFTTTNTTGSYFLRNGGTLTITYEDSEIDNTAYAKEVADGIKWSDLSNEVQKAVTQNLTLPTTLYGATVSWTSSDDSIINSAGEVTQSYKKQDVTLTANVSYKGKISSRDFEITVDKSIYNYTDAYTGNTNFVTFNSEDSKYISIDNSVIGIGGKAFNDLAYNVHDLKSVTVFNETTQKNETKDPYINYPVGTVLDADKKDDIMEFSVLLPTGTERMRFEAAILDNTGNNGGGGANVQKTFSYDLKSDGLYYGEDKIYDAKQNEWYNIAFVAPKGSDATDLVGELYINGELAHEAECSMSTSFGFRTFRFYGYDDTLDDPGYYLDNIRLYSGDYAPDRDKAPSVTSASYSVKDNVITIADNVTAAQLKAALTKDEDTVLRLYNAKTNMTTELSYGDVLTSGNILVAATTNGTNLEKGYSYYVIETAACAVETDILVNNASANVFGNSDTVSASVKFFNYSLGNQNNVKLYVAQYKNNELIGLWQDNESISNGETKTLSTDMAGFKDKEGSTLKLILVADDTLRPYIKPVTAEYRAEQ